MSYLIHAESEITATRSINARDFVKNRFDKKRLIRDIESLYLTLTADK